jgi:hypothetical protein
MNNAIQSITLQFKDGHEVVLSLDCKRGIRHPTEDDFVMLEVPVFTSNTSGVVAISPMQLDSFTRSGMIREVIKWMTRQTRTRNG